MVIIGGLLIFALYKLIVVKTITIEGESRYQTADIIEASEININDSMFRIKPSLVVNNIKSKLTYLGDVTLRFKLPTEIIIEVEEVKTKFSVISNGGYAFIDKNLAVITPRSAVPDPEAPFVRGIYLDDIDENGLMVTGDEDKLVVLKNIFQAVQATEFTDIKEINLVDIIDIKLVLANDCTVLLGGIGQLEYKLEFVSAILEQNPEFIDSAGTQINASSLDNGDSPNVGVLMGGQYTEIPAEESSQPADDEASSAQESEAENENAEAESSKENSAENDGE